jgi:hypothetical protein
MSAPLAGFASFVPDALVQVWPEPITLKATRLALNHSLVESTRLSYYSSIVTFKGVHIDMQRRAHVHLANALRVGWGVIRVIHGGSSSGYCPYVPRTVEPSMLVHARQCSPMLVHARQCSSMLVNSRPRSSMLVHARQCSSMLVHARPRAGEGRGGSCRHLRRPLQPVESRAGSSRAGGVAHRVRCGQW